MNLSSRRIQEVKIWNMFLFVIGMIFPKDRE